MIGEIEARKILQENRIERGMDPRECLEIVQALGLLPVETTTELIPVPATEEIKV